MWWAKIRPTAKRRPTANFESSMESSAFNEWKGVGGYAEVFSKYTSYFLHPLFKLRPRKTSLSAVSNYATQFGQSTQCLLSPIWVFALIVLKAKLRVISRFVRLANMNLNPLITQERDFDAFPCCRIGA
jgi:hypothetical protein